MDYVTLPAHAIINMSSLCVIKLPLVSRGNVRCTAKLGTSLVPAEEAEQEGNDPGERRGEGRHRGIRAAE